MKTNIFKQMSQSPNKMIEIVGSTSEKQFFFLNLIWKREQLLAKSVFLTYITMHTNSYIIL